MRRRTRAVNQDIDTPEEDLQQQPEADDDETDHDGLLRTTAAPSSTTRATRPPKKQTTDDTAALSSSEDEDDVESVNPETGLGGHAELDSNDNHRDAFLIADSENDEEMIVSDLPPLHASCFGRFEWIFRRWLTVLGCAFVVLVVDDLSLLMSLFGAVGQTGLALMPCAIHLKLQQRGVVPHSTIMSFVDGCTITFSVVVMLTGVVFSVQEIITKREGHE
jgi:hypothetical protein